MTVPSTAESNGSSTSDDNEIRSLIVKLLSATANGCLNELGYHPSVFQRMQATQQQLNKVSEERKKLYQDNCRLLALLKSQQEYVGLPESARVQRLGDLTAQVQSLTEERNAISANHATLSQEHQKLSEHFNNLRELHAKALKDITDFRSECARHHGNTAAHKEGPSLPKPPVNPPQTASRRPYPPAQSLPPPYQHYHPSTAYPQIHPQNAPQFNDAQRQQFVVPTQRNLPFNPAMSHPPPTRPPQGVSRPMRRSSAPVLDHQAPAWGTIAHPPPSQPLVSNPFQYHTFSNAPINRNQRPSLVVNTYPPYPYPVTPAPYPQVFSAPPNMHTVHFVPHNTANYTQSPSDPPTPSIPNFAMTKLETLPPQRSLKRKSSTPSTPALSPTANRSTSREMSEARTPIDSMIFSADLQPGLMIVPSAPPIVKADPQDADHSLQLPEQDGRDDAVVKKPRLEPQVPEPPAISVETSIETKPAFASVQELPAIEPAPDHSNDDDEDEDSDDDITEVGADGLRTPQNCVNIIMTPDENDPGLLTCRNCMARYSHHYVSDPPKPFVNASLDELIQHCMDEHPAAWETLRKGA